MISNDDSKSIEYSLFEQPFGKSWEEWTTQWWRWFFSIPKQNHPAYDGTGDMSNVKQDDPNVWFLAGTIGGKAERAIAIPSHKAVLCPVINVAISHSEDPRLKTDAQLTSFAKSNIDDIVIKEANVDGVDLEISENHRVRCPPFDFSFPTNNIYGVQDGLSRGAGDGYWIFLKPLNSGEHNIQTSGSCLSGRIQIEVKVNLIVQKGP
jgi:hypothetical protein